MVSFEKATHLEKTNVILEKIIEHAENVPGFLEEEGIYRISGNAGELDKLYLEAFRDPAQFTFENMEDVTPERHNITGLLKRFVNSFDLKWSDPASKMLEEELDKKEFNFTGVIEKLIKGNHLEEAKMLHNMMHLAYLIATNHEKNMMTESNVTKLYAPWLAQASNSSPILALQISARSSNVLAINALGEPVYGKTFDQTYPQPAQALAEQHEQIPARKVSPNSAQESSNQQGEITAANVKASTESLGSQIRSSFRAVGTWMTKTAFPAIKNFFNKTLPSWFSRLTGKKDKGINVEQMPKVSDPIQPKVAESQSIEPERNSQRVDPTPQAIQNDKMKVSAKEQPVAVEPTKNAPPPRPPRADKGETVRAPAQIVSAKIDTQQQSLIKEAKEKGLAFFKEREQRSAESSPSPHSENDSDRIVSEKIPPQELSAIKESTPKARSFFKELEKKGKAGLAELEKQGKAVLSKRGKPK